MNANQEKNLKRKIKELEQELKFKDLAYEEMSKLFAGCNLAMILKHGKKSDDGSYILETQAVNVEELLKTYSLESVTVDGINYLKACRKGDVNE